MYFALLCHLINFACIPFSLAEVVSERVSFEGILHSLTYHSLNLLQFCVFILFFTVTKANERHDCGCQRFSSKHNARLNKDFVSDVTIKMHSTLINEKISGVRLM